MCRVSVSTSYLTPDDDEVDIECECEVTAGSRDYYDPNYGWQPGDAAEVEILHADGSDGNDYREAIERDARWFDRVSENALTEADED